MVNIKPLRSEHDYVLNYIRIVNSSGKAFDFSAHMLRLTFEEDIFTGQVHGSIVAKDAVDYPSLLPIVGEEKIEFSFTRQDETTGANSVKLLDPIVFSGQVYVMVDKEIQSPSQKIQSYTLKFTSPGFIENMKTKVNKSWKGVKYSDIVKNIVADKLLNKNLIVEETSIPQNYIASNKRPITIIKEISKRSESGDGNGSLYTFYEDRDNYYFVTIGSMLDKEPIKTIRHEIRNVNDPNSPGDRQIERNINATVSYNQKTSFNLINNLKNGKGGSRLFTIDPIRRKYEILDFNLDDDWDKFKHTESAKPYNPETSSIIGHPEAKLSMIISDREHNTVEHLVAKDPNIKPNGLENVIQLRDSQMEQIKRNVITLSVPGDPRFRAGETLDFKIPEVSGKVSEEHPEQLDPFLQGKYLIVASTHVISENRYTVNLEIIKDAFFQEIFQRDPVQEMQNIF